MKKRKRIKHLLKQNRIFLLILCFLTYYSCSIRKNNTADNKEFCTVKYNIIQSDSLVHYLPKYNIEINFDGAILIWKAYLPNYPALLGKGKINSVDTFYVRDKKIFNKVENLNFLAYDSTLHSNFTFFRIEDPRIKNSFLIKKFNFNITDTTYINDVKAFKGMMTEDYLFIDKTDFYKMDEDQIMSSEFKFSSNTVTYMNPIIGILGYEKVGLEGFSYFFDSLSVSSNCKMYGL